MAKKKLTKELIQQAYEYAKSGNTREQIANNLGIATSTFFDYMNKYAEFSEAIKKGEKLAISEVENALFKRARGYAFIETTVETFPDGNQKKKVVQKQMAPDTGAAIFILKNKKSDEWKDVQEDTPDESFAIKVERIPNEN